MQHDEKTCTYCNGTGMWDDGDYCQVCGGNGFVVSDDRPQGMDGPTYD